MKNIAIIGGGAAGFFGAINIKRSHPTANVVLFEKTGKLLTKVLVSGGGRCNVTHACFDNSELVKSYPRGEKELRSVFNQFTTTDIINWFKEYGVDLKTESDGRMFPTSNSSSTIANCFLDEASRLGITINLHTELVDIQKNETDFTLNFKDGTQFKADRILITTGGNAKTEGFNFIKKLKHSIAQPIPSLFTFNTPNNPVNKLKGISVSNAIVSIAKTKLKLQGPLLITHWGFSGPVVLKLSAFGAIELSKLNYNFQFSVNWIGESNQEVVKESLLQHKNEFQNKMVLNAAMYGLSSRLWEYIVEKAEITAISKWADISKEKLNKLVAILTSDVYEAKGKTTFKEEFVTCGGVDLKEVDFKTMESKIVPGIYFAGEVLNIDGITGGFNFQNAWSTAWIAANNICKNIN